MKNELLMNDITKKMKKIANNVNEIVKSMNCYLTSSDSLIRIQKQNDTTYKIISIDKFIDMKSSRLIISKTLYDYIMSEFNAYDIKIDFNNDDTMFFINITSLLFN